MTRSRIIRIGRCKLWLRDGEAPKLTLEERDDTPFRGRTGRRWYAPKLTGWDCYFVGRYPDRTVWSYRRVTS